VSIETNYWFRAKRSGLGWGLPCSWQGWVFFIVWLSILPLAAIRLMPKRPFTFAMVLGLMTIALALVCYIKGEPLDGRRQIR